MVSDPNTPLLKEYNTSIYFQRSPTLSPTKRWDGLYCFKIAWAFFASVIGAFLQFRLPWKFIYGKSSAISSPNLKWQVKIRLRSNQSYGVLKSAIFDSSAGSPCDIFHNFRTMYRCQILMKFAMIVSFTILYCRFLSEICCRPSFST